MSENIIPSQDQRQVVRVKIVQTVGDWLTSRIDEVFEMADEDQTPDELVCMTWRDLTELRWQICGCIATDLEHELGEQVEEILREEFALRRSTHIRSAKPR